MKFVLIDQLDFCHTDGSCNNAYPSSQIAGDTSSMFNLLEAMVTLISVLLSAQ